jgi:hypothetical protein
MINFLLLDGTIEELAELIYNWSNRVAICLVCFYGART